MKGSFGLGRNSGGFNGGNGSGGGGGMMRTVGRAMRSRINGLQDPFVSSSSSTKTRTFSNEKRSSTPPKARNEGFSMSVSSRSNGGNVPVSGVLNSCPFVEVFDGEIDDDDQWECLENYYDPVFGVVPSNHEVQHAVLSLQQFLHPSPRSQTGTEEILSDADNDIPDCKTSATDMLQRGSSVGSDMDWIEPSMQLYDQRLAQSYGWEKVYDAFHLLQTEPSVQKMVVSLSSDKAVWDAVLKNETVREIRDLYLKSAEATPVNTDKNSDRSNENSNVLKWIMEHMKGKLLEIVGNITQFVGGIFKPVNPDKSEESLAFSEKLKSSFLLTIIVLLVVVVTRGSKA
ncbi:hypothetical protein RND81_14G129800 [Saponaria officinalis]|uniref:Uncharacterized protein n=1 Tax=Saponaria officinalis TaxID=3572 RepID=A0AAW1GLV0_SAPOF